MKTAMMMFALCLLLPLFSEAVPYPTEEAATKAMQELAERSLNRLHFLKERKIIGIELLTAGPYLDSPTSWGGHSSVRFVDDDSKPLNDLVFSFEMRVFSESQLVLYGEGLVGRSAIVPTIYTLNEVIENSVRNEGRTLRRTILPANESQIQRLLELAKRYLLLPELADHYQFLGNNCATLTLKMLKEIGIQVNYGEKYKVDVPVQLSDLLRQNGYTVFPDIEINLAYETQNRLKAFGKSLKLRGETDSPLNFPEFWKYLASFPDAWLVQAYYAWPTEWSSGRISVMELILSRNIRNNWSMVFNIKAAPPELYQFCMIADVQCRVTRYKKALTLFSPAKLYLNQSAIQTTRWKNRFLPIYNLQNEPKEDLRFFSLETNQILFARCKLYPSGQEVQLSQILNPDREVPELGIQSEGQLLTQPIPFSERSLTNFGPSTWIFSSLSPDGKEGSRLQISFPVQRILYTNKNGQKIRLEKCQF